jgi:hypothetical protein
VEKEERVTDKRKSATVQIVAVEQEQGLWLVTETAVCSETGRVLKEASALVEVDNIEQLEGHYRKVAEKHNPDAKFESSVRYTHQAPNQEN